MGWGDSKIKNEVEGRRDNEEWEGNQTVNCVGWGANENYKWDLGG